MVPTFSAIDWFEVAGRGSVAMVRLDRETDDFRHLIGHDVRVDGRLYRCTAVERFAHLPPWREGERVGLLVELIAAR